MIEDPERAYRWMVDELNIDRESYEDSAGCCCLTHLSEQCAWALDLYEDGFDFVIPEWVFDQAPRAADFVGGFNE